MNTKDIVYVALFAALMAALGVFPPITIPALGVPITAQSMGIMLAGGTVNGVYPTYQPDQLAYVLNDSQTRFLFVENEEQLDKFITIRDQAPGVETVFFL